MAFKKRIAVYLSADDYNKFVALKKFFTDYNFNYSDSGIFLKILNDYVDGVNFFKIVDNAVK